jgi:hypothetical protein
MVVNGLNFWRERLVKKRGGEMRKQTFFLLFIATFLIRSLCATADWTILSYIQSDNNLYDYVLRDLSEMSAVGSNERLNIIAQIDIPENNGTWRYKVDKGELTLDTYLESEMGQNVTQEVVDAMHWAKNNYPAKHYMLILSGHGSGVIDPNWGRLRGILFDDSDETYMNNQQLAFAMNQIKTNVLAGCKLDVLGMDSCLMAMFEVAYQIKESANVLVASQESESAHGWYYSSFLSYPAAAYCTPAQLAGYAVSTFGLFYQNRKDPYYTQSAVSLSNLDLIKNNINEVVANLNACKRLERKKINRAVNRARSNALEFDYSDYIDLYSFYSDLYNEIKDLVQKISGETSSNVRPRPSGRRNIDDAQELKRPARPRPNSTHARPSSRPRPRPRPSSTSPRPTSPRPTNPRPTSNESVQQTNSSSSSSQTTSSSSHPRPRPRPSASSNLRPRPPRPTSISSHAQPSTPSTPTPKPKTNFEIKIDALKESLTDGMQLINNAVLSNVSGSKMSKAKGISIYYPKGSAHSSYSKTQFAKDSLWLSFLNEYA